MGLVLIQAMHYEIRLAGSANLLPAIWHDTLVTGSEVVLNARIQKNIDETGATCSTCSTAIPVSATGSHSQDSGVMWFSWFVHTFYEVWVWLTRDRSPHCSKMTIVTTSDEPSMSLHPSNFEADVSHELPEDTNGVEEIYATSNSNSGSDSDLSSTFTIEFAVKHCKRVHIITQRLPEYVLIYYGIC